MIDFLSFAARTCARMIAMTDVAARGPRGRAASLGPGEKSPKINSKTLAEESQRRSPRQPSILPQSTAPDADSCSSCSAPRAMKSLPWEFDVASFCSELETIRAALMLAPEAPELPESSPGPCDAQEKDAAEMSASLTPSHELEDGLPSIEDDLAYAVHLLGSDRTFR